MDQENSKLDPFDPASLRISQDYVSMAGVKKILSKIPVRKPTRQEYVRVNPSEDYRITTAILELKDDRETFIVTPTIRDDLASELVPVQIFTAINRQGVVFLWPCKLPDETGRTNAWWESALEAAQHAHEKWVRISSNMSLGAYQIYEAEGDLSEPEWPSEDFHELLKIAFRGSVIDSFEHPVLKRLRGAI